MNNARYGQVDPLELIRPEELRAQFEMNVIGLRATTNNFLPLLRRDPSARILQVASMLGRLSIPLAGYCNTFKHAVMALAESLRPHVPCTSSRDSLFGFQGISAQFQPEGPP